MPKLEMLLLGGLTIRQDGLPLPELKTQKGQALLCYLAVTRRPAPRTLLAGLFWPDMPEADAHMNLRKVLVRLKPLALHLSITRAALAFSAEAAPTLDVSEFEAAAIGKSEVAQLQQAVDLYQGDFLDGFYLEDAPLFDEWAAEQRARLRGLALGALNGLIAHLGGQAEYETAIRYAGRVLALEPWHEETHRELMRLLALSGQRGAALLQFETCRGCLARELGVDPAPATVQLYEQIKSGMLEGALSGAAGPLHNLPAQTTAFVGREQELAALAEHFADPHVRLVTILGLGGMGKTRLALAAAGAHMEPNGPVQLFAHGVIFIGLARLETPDQLVPALAEALNLRFSPGSEPKAQLLDYLRGKAMLLVLDNFEHLNHRASLLDELLRAAAKLKILVTSREKLNLQAEQLFPIGGMALPRDGNVEALASYGAVELFCERARRVRPDFVLTASNQQSVVEICRLVQGMPLGIVLAAAWLETYSPQGIAAEIRANLDFLESEMEDMPERQRSLRAAFNHAWRLLLEQERAVFQRLSTFRGGFTRQAAEAVAGATRRDLQGLVNKSLLAASAEGRYEVHELLRQFAAEKLAAAPEQEAAARDRHSAYYCNFLSEQTNNWHNAQQIETLNAVTLEADNAQRAWQWAVERADWLRLRPALDSWAWYYNWRGREVEGEVVFRTIVEQVAIAQTGHLPASPDLSLVAAKALTWQGTFALNSHSAQQTLRRALSVFEQPELAPADVRRERAFALKALGDAYSGSDRHSTRQLLEQSLALYQACGDAWGISIGLNSLAHLEWGTGEYAQAQAHAQTALALHQVRGDVREQTYTMTTLAWIYQHLGSLDQAVRLRREVLELSQQSGDYWAQVNGAACLAYSLYWQGKFDEVQHWADYSLAICLELGQHSQEGFVRLAGCCAHLIMGRYVRARQAAEPALAMAREAGNAGVEATVIWALGYLAVVEHDYDQARSAFAESRRLYEAVKDNYIGLMLSGPGYLACAEGHAPQARPYFVEALQFSLALKDYLTLNVTLPGVALWLALTGQITRAVEVWALALSLPYVANSQWHADVVGQRVEAAAATLAPAAREAARARGRALDLWGTAEALVDELQQFERAAARVLAGDER